MNILIVEDEGLKRSQLIEFIKSILKDSAITEAKSLQSGLRTVISNNFNLIILDMTMHNFDVGVDEDGGRPLAYAGRELLRQMDRRKIRMPVIVVTQFDKFGEGAEFMTLSELDNSLKSNHNSNYLGAVYFNPLSDSWKDSLMKLLKEMI